MKLNDNNLVCMAKSFRSQKRLLPLRCSFRRLAARLLAFGGNLFTAFLWPTWLTMVDVGRCQLWPRRRAFWAGQKDDKKRSSECSSNTKAELGVNPFG